MYSSLGRLASAALSQRLFGCSGLWISRPDSQTPLIRTAMYVRAYFQDVWLAPQAIEHMCVCFLGYSFGVCEPFALGDSLRSERSSAPWAGSSPKLALVVLSGGGGGQCSCSQVLEIACEGYGDQESISISTALQLLCTCRCRSAGAAEAFKQLVWLVGRRCDLHFAKVLCGGSTAKLNDMTGRQLDKALCKYLMACQKSFANARSVHIAMDASMVAKKPLMFSGAALPDNTGVVLPPWASVCGSILQSPIKSPLSYAGFRLVVRVCLRRSTGFLVRSTSRGRGETCECIAFCAPGGPAGGLGGLVLRIFVCLNLCTGAVLGGSVFLRLGAGGGRRGHRSGFSLWVARINEGKGLSRIRRPFLVVSDGRLTLVVAVGYSH